MKTGIRTLRQEQNLALQFCRCKIYRSIHFYVTKLRKSAKMFSTKDAPTPYYNDYGILVMSIYDFLLNENSPETNLSVLAISYALTGENCLFTAFSAA